MILKLKNSVQQDQVQKMAQELKAFVIEDKGHPVLINGSGQKSYPAWLSEHVQESIVFDDDIQLSSRKYQKRTREIDLGNGVVIGGDSYHTVLMSGPCSVESEEQITACAEKMLDLGVKILRGGCFKPRTSPYSFQGMGSEGLQLLVKMREKYGLKIITEIRDATHADEVIESTDIIQIGAKAMYDHGILKKAGQSQKPVLLKRGFGSNIKEFVQMAEFVLSLGNPSVILCERGIRTFETKTRFTLDLCAVAWLQEHTNLPVVVDPSHAMGYRYGVPALAAAGAAMGVDGLLVESHPKPSEAKSDAAQQMALEDMDELSKQVQAVCQAVGYSLV